MLLDNIKKYYLENAFHATVDTQFKLATLGNDAGIFGGAKLAKELQKVNKKINQYAKKGILIFFMNI